MGVGELETWKPRFCRMGQRHWTILVDKYKVWTSEFVGWSAENSWFLDNQCTETPKMQRMAQEIAHLLLEAQPYPPCEKATRPFMILWEWKLTEEIY